MTERINKDFAMQAESLADKRQVIVNISAEEPDRAGDIVVQKGIDFSAFMTIGGTVLWQHDADKPIAKAIEMGIVANKLRARVQFPQPGAAPKADEIYGLIRAGIVNAASIGFTPIDYEPIDPKEPYGGMKFSSVELMEFSFVSIPCARDATIVARSSFRSGEKGNAILGRANTKAIGDALVTGLSKRAAELGIDLFEGLIETPFGDFTPEDWEEAQEIFRSIEKSCDYFRQHGSGTVVTSDAASRRREAEQLSKVSADGRPLRADGQPISWSVAEWCKAVEEEEKRRGFFSNGFSYGFRKDPGN